MLYRREDTKEFSTAEFDAFARSLLVSRDWLRGKGGDCARYVARLGGSKLIEKARVSEYCTVATSAIQ